MSEPEPMLSLRRVAHPSDANHQGTVFGGFILSLIDEAAYLEVRRHGVHRWVTVSMDRVEFKAPVRVGDVVSLFTHASQMGRSSITVQVAGPREAEVWLFTVERQEALALPGGEADTVKLVRHPRKPFDQKLEFWLAPTLAWLPVRLRITEHNGDYLDQKWESTQAPS
jgi:acyl-coenzyme A thioesterase PaaI-like protein